jgi:hypothetical protein
MPITMRRRLDNDDRREECLQALSHDVIAGTSRFEIQRGGRQLVGAALRCGNVSSSHKLA